MAIEFHSDRYKKKDESHTDRDKKESETMHNHIFESASLARKKEKEERSKRAFEELKKIKIVLGSEELDPKQ